MIEAAQRDGIDVKADQYPYTRCSTLFQQVHSAGALRGPAPFGHMTGDQILIAAAPLRPEWEGQTLGQLAASHGLSEIDMVDQIVAVHGATCFVVLDAMNEGDVRTATAYPSVLIGSDGIAAGSRPHPRLAHTFPRVLGTYARELSVVTLPGVVHRMTQLSARHFGLVDRGEIRPGAFADLVLFDASTIIDTGTYTDP